MSSDDDTAGGDLTLGLLRGLEESAFGSKQFCPDGCMNRIITAETVSRTLEAVRRLPSIEPNEQRTLRSLVDFVSKENKAIFAILLFCGLSSKNLRQALTEFKKIGFDNSKLPIFGNDIERIFLAGTGKGYKKPWNVLRVHNFCDSQWKFLAPIFDNGQSELVLHDKQPLPFLRVNQRKNSGTFGEVYQVAIHPDHLKSAVHASVAIKRLRPDYDEDEATQRTLKAEWEKEVNAHKHISQFNSPNIIKFMTAFTQGHDRYLMFEWANGGNLREFWTTYSPDLTLSLVKDVMLQLCGLADALSKMHDMNYRHGDIKPENILRVTTASENGDVGTLKICDMGLSKNHTMATRLRDVPTTTMFTTWRYEPPEAKRKDAIWPRRYDIWSIGCIILEFIVWLVDGPRGLDKFNKKIINREGGQCHYFEVENRNGMISYKVHSAVLAAIRSLSRHPQCEDGTTALGELLRVVKTRLLIVALDSGSLGESRVHFSNTNTQDQTRAEAMELKENLVNIIRRANEGQTHWAVTPEPEIQNSLTVAWKPSFGSAGGLLTTDSSSLFGSMLTGGLRTVRVVGRRGHSVTISRSCVSADSVSVVLSRKFTYVFSADILCDDRRKTLMSRQLNNTWDFPVDNSFAARHINMIDTAGLFPKHSSSTKLCVNCQQLEFWRSNFSVIDSWNELQNGSRICDFCRMRWEVSNHLNQEECTVLRFDRDQSMLKLNKGNPPVLSIHRGLETQISRATHIQIGYPQLPGIAGQTQYSILRQCLNDCDAEHRECRTQKLGPLPTRLIHLRAQEPSMIFLYETRPEDNIEYIALSHPWGRGPHFCTTFANVEAHRRGINFEDLPPMFQDAVVSTRELGMEYLWIDSICIIQGEGGDFDQEAKRMEDVFSSAFCVIAASSALGQNDGFLHRRNQQREILAFESAGLPTLYVSRFIDDFNKDVLESPLNKRGWVLQERALARRTIYFTKSQIYWECGKGVRCETLTKMDNKLVSFLGDPNFPSKLSNDATTRGVKIRLYEELYRQYTRLEFTRISDRPIAIAGLEKRLIRDLKAQGGFGVFDDGRSLFQRSLLWQRGREVRSLEKIPCIPSLKVPSWSWMAYDGGIDFLDLPLGGVNWFTDDIKSPWAPGAVDTWHTGDGKESVGLKARARTLALVDAESAARNGVVIVWDSADMIKIGAEDLMCVVVGREKKKDTAEETIHFALVIRMSKGPMCIKEGSKICERVGVGHMKGKFLGSESLAQAVLIR